MLKLVVSRKTFLNYVARHDLLAKLAVQIRSVDVVNPSKKAMMSLDLILNDLLVPR